MVYSGTIVNYGRGEFVVTETGMQTELGHIADMIQIVVQEQTPLQKRLDRLGKWLAGRRADPRGRDLRARACSAARATCEELLLTAVSLAVAAVPEALTAVVTIALSLGAQRMLKRQALIRKLPAVETLGSVTVICSDKTGTLTQNRMTVTALDIANHSLRADAGDADEDGIRAGADRAASPAPGAQPTLDLLLIAGALCNDAVLVARRAAIPADYPRGRRPDRGALVLAAAYAGIKKDDLEAAFPRVAEAALRLGAQAHDHGAPRAAEPSPRFPTASEPCWETAREPGRHAAVHRLHQGRHRRHAEHLRPGVGRRRASQPAGRGLARRGS